MAIHIKKKNIGKFTVTKKKTGKSTEELTHSKDALTRKRAIFAQNAKKWNHKENGGTEGDGLSEFGGIIGDTFAMNKKRNGGGIDKNNYKRFVDTFAEGGGFNFMSLLGNMGGSSGGGLGGLMGSSGGGMIGGTGGGGGGAMAGQMVSQMADSLGSKIPEDNGRAGMSASVLGQGAKGLTTGVSKGVKVAGPAGGVIGGIVGLVGGAIKGAVQHNKIKREVELQDDQQSAHNMSKYVNRPVNTYNTFGQYLNGGDLEQYNTVSHRLLPDNFANTQLDGKGIQLEKKETVFRKDNGGDYVFSDKLINPDTNNTFAKDSKRTENKTQKPYFDPISRRTKEIELMNLQSKNDIERQKVEGKMTGGMKTYKYGGTTKAETGLDGESIVRTDKPYDFDMPYLESKGSTSISSLSGNKDNYIPSKVPNSSLPKQSVNNGLLGKLFNEALKNGNTSQLAGQSIPSIYNARKANENTEVQQTYLDNTNLSAPVINKDIKPFLLAQNAARSAINEGNASQGVRNANLSAITTKTQENLGNYALDIDKENKLLDLQARGAQSQQKSANIDRLYKTDDINAMNRAAKQRFGATAANQAGQGLVEAGKMQGETLNNNIKNNLLKYLSGDFSMDKEGNITYKGRQISDKETLKLYEEEQKKATEKKKLGGTLNKIKARFNPASLIL